MNPLKIKKGPDPEEILQAKLVELMQRRQWYVHETHGSMYSKGWPDVYAAHVSYGLRWIECKNAAGYHFTRDQLTEFPLMMAKNVGIWVVALYPGFTDAQLMYEYENVVQNGPPNWTKYLNHSTRPY